MPSTTPRPEYVTLRAKTLALGSGWSADEAVCIDTGLRGCTYISTDLILPEIIRYVPHLPGRLRMQAKNVEEDGWLSAAILMRAAADEIEFGEKNGRHSLINCGGSEK